MHDLLLFDLDGTLSDPIEGTTRCINHALIRSGFDAVDEASVAPFIGPPLNNAFEAIVGSSSAELVDHLISCYRDRYTEIGYSECRLYPGIEQALRHLHASGLRLAVCTSKRVDYAERILQMFDLLELFEFVSGGEIRVPKVQQVAELRERGRVTKQTVMIGDRAVDLIAAHSNALCAGGVLWGYGSREEITAENPRYVFDSPAALWVGAPLA